MPGSIGTKLEYSDTDSSYTELGCIVQIDAPSIKKNVYEVKCLGSASRWVSKAGAFVDGGQVTFTTEYSGAKFTTILGKVDDETPGYWQILVPVEGAQTTGAKIKFQALLSEMGLPFPDDGGRLLISVTLEVSGAVTFVAGS